MPRSLLIVDDDGSFRRLARTLLSGPFTIVGEAATREEALRAVVALVPDAVLLDVHLPDGDGFSVARELGAGPSPPAVVLTSADDLGGVAEAVAGTGARGFLPKASISADVLERLLLACE
jgi:two-component system nitrate/nitrite response regulator NarL